MYDEILNVIDWTDVGTAVVATAALVAAVFVLIRGSRMVLAMISGNSVVTVDWSDDDWDAFDEWTESSDRRSMSDVYTADEISGDDLFDSEGDDR